MPENAVGLVVGVFDLFHVGHLDALRSAAARCDRLVVGVASDDLAARVTGREPYVPERERREILAAVRGTAGVVVLETDEPARDVAELAPDVILVPSDDAAAELVVAELAAAEGLAAVPVEVLPESRSTASTAVREALAVPASRESVA
jgi:glycerol-3-phosphate cytidylyltransferase